MFYKNCKLILEKVIELCNPLVSVVMPTYNRSDLIEISINSVLSQTYNNIELIVVDDGSKDETKNIIEGIINKNKNISIRYIYKNNQGVSSARNKGIIESKGKYIMFIDSDDTIEKDKIKRQIDVLEKLKYSICYCGTIVNNKITNNKKKLQTKFREGYLLIDILKSNINSQIMGWMFKREFLITNNLRFSEDIKYGEDLEFIFRANTLAKACCVDDYLCNYYIHNNSSIMNMNARFNDIFVFSRFKLWAHKNNDNYESNMKDVDRTIDNYLIPFSILSIIYGISKNNSSQNELIKYMNVYRNEIKRLDISICKMAIKGLFYRLYILFKIKYREFNFK